MIDNETLLGKHLPTTNFAIKATKIKSHDPRSRKVYSCRVKKGYSKQGIFKEQAILASQATEFLKGDSGISRTEFLANFAPRINALHVSTRTIKQQSAAAAICKIYTGGRDYSPAAQVFKDTVSLWRQRVNQRNGILTSRNALKVIAKRLKFFTEQLKAPFNRTG